MNSGAIRDSDVLLCSAARDGCWWSPCFPSQNPNHSLVGISGAPALQSYYKQYYNWDFFFQWKAGTGIVCPGSPYIAELPRANTGLGFLWPCQRMSRDRCPKTDHSVRSFMSNLFPNSQAQLRSNASTEKPCPVFTVWTVGGMISPEYLSHTRHKHRQGRAAKPQSHFQLVQPLIHKKQ